MREKRIQGVSVNLDAFAGAKSLADLKKEEGKIFSSLSKEQADASYAELWDELNPGKKAKSEVPAPAPDGGDEKQ